MCKSYWSKEPHSEVDKTRKNVLIVADVHDRAQIFITECLQYVTVDVHSPGSACAKKRNEWTKPPKVIYMETTWKLISEHYFYFINIYTYFFQKHLFRKGVIKVSLLGTLLTVCHCHNNLLQLNWTSCFGFMLQIPQI